MLSPDIIPFDRETIDPQHLKSTYKSYINQPLRTGVANNIYVRCASQFDGTLPHPLFNTYLYYSTNNLIAWPDYWQSKVIGTPLQAQNILPEEAPLWIGATKPYVWNPPPLSGRHYSLVSYVSLTPSAIPKLTDWSDYLKFVQYGSYGVLNQNWFDTTTAEFSNTVAFEMRQSSTNGNTVQVLFTFNPQNLPVGTVISVGSDTYNPDGAPLSFSPITITDTTQPSVLKTTIPANFKCNLTINYTISPSVTQVPTDATLSLSVGVVQGKELLTLGTENISFSGTMHLSHMHDVYFDKVLLGDTTMYDDFFVRDQFGDTNAVPRSDGTVSGCVDIQPYGVSPCSNPANQFLTDANFAVDYTTTNSVQIRQGQPNYIYVRGQNLGPNGAYSSGQMSLFFSPSSLLADPTNWAGNMIPGDNGAYQVNYTADANGRAVCTFVWTNPPPPPDGQHYCLLCQIITSEHPNPFPLSFSSEGGLVNFILNNIAWGWRNTSYLPYSSKTITQIETFTTGTMTNTSWNLSFALTNPPINSEVSASSPSPIPVPMINIPMSPITDPNVSPGSITFKIPPANFSTNINVTWFDNGVAVPSGFTFAISVLNINPQGSPLYRYGKKLPQKVGVIPQSAITCGRVTHFVQLQTEEAEKHEKHGKHHHKHGKEEEGNKN